MVGCADIEPPELSWYRRQGDVATVGCKEQDVTWVLTCTNHTWNGVIGNCTRNEPAAMSDNTAWSNLLTTGADSKTMILLPNFVK